MKILFITHYDNLYGANNSLLKIATRIKENGDVPIVVTNTEGALSEELKKRGIEYYICGVTQWQAIYSTPLRFLVKKVKRKAEIKKEINQLFEYFKDKEIDIIHSNSSVIVHGAILSSMLACKHIWHIREFSKEHFDMRYFYGQKRVNELFSKADILITISDALKDNYKAKYPTANIVRIYNGVTVNNTHDDFAVTKNDKASDKIKFVCVGYLFKMKHQLELIKACKKLNQSGVNNFEMHFIGDGKDDYKALIENELKDYKSDNIIFHGYMKNVNEMLLNMDVGVIASEYEGFGLVTVEYMLAKLPVIGRNSGGTPEIIDNGVTGYVYDTEEELIDKMKKLIEDSSLRKEMGEKGYTRAVSSFTEEKYTGSVMKLYKTII